jgi:hypothetical protein
MNDWIAHKPGCLVRTAQLPDGRQKAEAPRFREGLSTSNYSLERYRSLPWGNLARDGNLHDQAETRLTGEVPGINRIHTCN